MRKMVDIFKKNWLVIAFLVIMVGAVFVRTYNFQDWLYFKMDQSRDAMLISNAIDNGAGYLPLLGPRAGATTLENGFLRLGPAYYYFQYLAALIAHSTQPYVFAYPDLFFSIVVIPLLYFFARIYFSKRHSMYIVAMYAFSFIIIQYSRFAWNPNSLQFFVILTFFSLLKFLSEKNEKKSRWWLALWSLALAIGSQLHFFGFFSLVGISGLLSAFHSESWKKSAWGGYLTKEKIWKFIRYCLIIIAVFAVIYTPVIISDVFEKGQNANNFIEALESKPSKQSFSEKVSKNINENLRYYCLITTSECYQNDVKKNAVPLFATAMVMLLGITLVVFNLRKTNDIERRNFLALLLIWVGVFFVLTIPVSFQLRPRFFIIVFAVPFIFLGLLFEFLENRYGKKMIYASFAIALMIVLANMNGTYAWFKEQSASQQARVSIDRTLILKTKDGVTLGQLQRVADFIYANYKEGRNVYYYVKPEHERPIQYLLEEKHDPSFNFSYLKINQDSKAQYFAIVPNKKNGLDKVTNKYDLYFDVISSDKIGQLLVAEIVFPTRAVSDDFKVKTNGSNEDRIFWKDVFGL